MAFQRDITKAWFPDENFLSNPDIMDSIWKHILQAATECAKTNQSHEYAFICSFLEMLKQYEITNGSKKEEAILSHQ